MMQNKITRGTYERDNPGYARKEQNLYESTAPATDSPDAGKWGGDDAKAAFK